MSTSEELVQILDHYLEHAKEELPKVVDFATKLDDAGRLELAGVVGRFDMRSNKQLSPKERLFAGRVLARLEKIDVESLTALNRVLDYVDLNANAQLEEAEVELAVELMEAFATADSDNGTLSTRELDMLYAVLRNLDKNNSRKLEGDQRMKLREQLREPKRFLEMEKQNNPILRELLGLS